jgi:hypothetical protein
MGEVTTIKVRKHTKRELARLGGKEDSYDDIVNRLIEFYKSNSRKPVDG